MYEVKVSMAKIEINEVPYDENYIAQKSWVYGDDCMYYNYYNIGEDVQHYAIEHLTQITTNMLKGQSEVITFGTDQDKT